VTPVQIGSFSVGAGHQLAFIAGACVIEGGQRRLEVALAFRDIWIGCERSGVGGGACG
jgi:3-deoxy-D-manno-octulosonic acid (KDO) 8-phosphate synthase